MLSILAIALRFFGIVQWAIALEKSLEVKKRAQAMADMPTTKQERTDAADKGTL